ncbi:hypothetical protein MMC12_003652 [Toensbergia leucococca]|nr:hypothetical protein [Toensbergia leucococca]
MAEPLSLIASLVAVIQISGSVISGCYSTARVLRDIVERLVALVDHENMSSHEYLSTLTDIMSTNRPLEICQQDLEMLQTKIEKPIDEWRQTPIHPSGYMGFLAVAKRSIIIEDVTHQTPQQHTSAVLYYYFDFSDKMDSSVESLLRSLVTQLVK